jgi:putative transposase
LYQGTTLVLPSIPVEAPGFRPAKIRNIDRALALETFAMPLAPQEVRTFFVTAVTWQRRPLFRADPMARLFIDTLFRYRNQRSFLLHEFVLMPDHFHLLLTPAYEVSLGESLQLVKGGFSFRAKKELRSNLEIWQPGFTEHRVHDCEDFRGHATYIRENPVRAGLAEDAITYPYSSAAAGIEADPEPPWLKPLIKEAAFSPV